MQRTRIPFYHLIWAVCVMCLLGCANNNSGYPQSSAVTTNGEASFNVAKYEADKAHLESELAKDGIQIINVGEDYLMIIPSGRLFYPQSPRIYWSSYALLNKVMCYLNLFDKTTIKIAGYADCLGSEKHNYALSLARASAVANYLWSQDLDTRLAYVKGYGSSRPMISPWDTINRSQNERIEIIFRKVAPLGTR